MSIYRMFVAYDKKVIQEIFKNDNTCRHCSN